MRARHAAIGSLIAVAVCSIVMCDAQSASAQAFAVCAEVHILESGRYKEDKCRDEATPKNYTWVFAAPGTLFAPGVECASVAMRNSGRYINSTCTEEEGSPKNYLLITARPFMPPPRWIPRDGVPALFATATAIVKCSSGESKEEAEISSEATASKITLALTGCKARKGSEECEAKSPGAKANEIDINPLKGELGTVATTEAASGMGILLEPESGSEWAKIEKSSCIGETVISGSIAAEITPVGEPESDDDMQLKSVCSSEQVKTITVASGAVKPSLKMLGVAATVETTIEDKFHEEIAVLS
jgi:hypothetical protein